MEDFDVTLECLLQRGAERLRGHQRRLFMAEVTLGTCGGSARRAERRFGWGRATVQKGLHELHKGIRCVENFSARGRLLKKLAETKAIFANIRRVRE